MDLRASPKTLEPRSGKGRTRNFLIVNDDTANTAGCGFPRKIDDAKTRCQDLEFKNLSLEQIRIANDN